MSKFLQKIGGAVLSILETVDRYVYGSISPMSQGEVAKDPYTAYRIGREKGGTMLRSLSMRGWLALGFEEAQATFLDPRFSSDVRTNKFVSGVVRTIAAGRRVPILDDPAMVNRDPPDHTRLRKLVQQGFLHKYILSLEPRIRSIVQQCLDTYDQSGQFDIVEQLAKPLPAIVIAEMMGLPEEDRKKFQDMSIRLLGITALGDDELMSEGIVANEELVEYFSAIIEEKRNSPDQSLISRLIETEEEGDQLTTEELYSTCVLLLIAGHETTTRLIGNGMYTLLQHPEQFEMLKQDPSLTPNAVEEMLRYEPPVQFLARYATSDFEFFGKKIKKGQMVVPIIGAANRDPAINDNPDVFDITREEVKHISFGHGIHLCLGLNLARLEAQVAIDMLLERFPHMTMAEQEFTWTVIPLVRGLDNLVVDVNEDKAIAAA